VLAKTNPAEAAKLAAMVADPAQQDRIAKSTALVSLIKFNSMDPDIPQLFHEMHPEAVPGSYRGMPPDKTGMSGYGQYDVKGADGVIRTQMFTPADLDNAIMSTVSPAKMYEMALAGKEGERKGEETKSDIEFKKKRIGLLEKEYDEGGPQRQATLEGTRARTAHERATTGAIGDTKVAAAEAKGKEAGIKTWMRMHGVDNAMMQDKDSPQRKEVFNSYADAEDIAAANPTMKKMDSGTMLRLKKVMEDIAAGSDRVYKKKGTEKYVYNPTDDPGSEIAIPSHLVTAMKKEAEKKGAPVKRGVF
jgi:hypothetical protein